MSPRAIVFSGLSLLVGCSGALGVPETSATDAAPADAAPTDAAPTDAAPTDAAPTDAAPTDAAPADAAPTDAAPTDTGPPDSTPIASDVAPADTQSESDAADDTTDATDAADAIDARPATNTLTQLPYFENSSPWGRITELTDNRLLLYTSETGLYYKDLADPAGIWHRFFAFDGFRGSNTFGEGVGSAVQDPASPNAIYFCTGDNGSPGYNHNIDARTHQDLGAIFLSDNLKSATQIAGNQSAWERLVVGCPSEVHARYIVETEPEPDIEMWILSSRADLFAFDDRETVVKNGLTVSRSFYYMTHDKGLYRATYSGDEGTLAWESVHMKPAFFDNGTRGGVFGQANVTDDWFYYEYAPQRGAPDQRDSYPPQGGTTECNYPIAGAMVYGDFEATTGLCVEDEHHGVGTVVLIDPVYHAYHRDLGIRQSAILLAGYFVQPIWPHGGLFRGVVDEHGAIEWTELTHRDPASGTAIHLDVRDIACDDQQMTILATGAPVARYCYVAAGRNGVFKVTAHPDGTTSLEDISDALMTRDAYMESCAGKACSDTVSYQYAGIDQAYVDGVSHLLLTAQLDVFYATDDFATPIRWNEISGPGMTWGGVIDPVGRHVYVGSNGVIERIATDQLATPATGWEEVEAGFGDRSAAQILLDPANDRRAHFPGLDPTYSSVAWDASYRQVLEYYRPRTLGFCYGARYGPSGALFRYNSYGKKVFGAIDADTGKYVLYSTGSHFNNLSDGALYRGEWDPTVDYDADGTTEGDYRWALATGDHGCSPIRPYPNSPTCYYACDAAASTGALPKMTMGDAVADPKNADHLYLLGRLDSDEMHHLFESKDGGATWVDRSDLYVFGAPGGPSLASIASNPYELLMDPQDPTVLYISYFGGEGIFRLDVDEGYFRDITNLDPAAENNANAVTLPPRDTAAAGSRFTYLGTTIYKMPTPYDLEAVVDPATGLTRLYVAVAPYCDGGGWGIYPATACGFANGGGIYSRLIDPDAHADADVPWDKLNGDNQALRYFMAYRVAVSPADPDVIVATGANLFPWASGGNPEGLTAGIIHSRDGGVTWARSTDLMVNATGVAGSYADPNLFVVGLESGGLWELYLGAP